MISKDVAKLSIILDKKVTEGVNKLEGIAIDDEKYQRVLTNVITSITVLDKISFKPQPKQKPKKEEN